MSSNFTQDNKGAAAVDRALAVVRVIAQQAQPITLANLSRATGFYKSTLLRLLASLEKASLIVRRQDGRYALGTYAHELGRSYEAAYRISEVLRPILLRLVEQGSESSSFHVFYDAESRICLLRVNSHHSILDSIQEGDYLPLAQGAAGKVISMFQGADVLPNHENILMVSIGERDPSCAAVASPVFRSGNEFCGAISLSGPQERFNPEAIQRMSVAVQEAAKLATQQLGGIWPTT